jgi:hypothetical protein
MAEIYALMSTRDRVIRYIGQTKGFADKRAWDHWRCSSNLKVANWSREELWGGYTIDYVVIEECAEEERHPRETYWIQRVPNLLNERKVNLPAVQPSNDEVAHLNALRQRDQAGEIDNWRGFVGITYYPPYERARSNFFDDGTELMPESWGSRVHDPFGKSWGNSGPAFNFKTALHYRQLFREQAESYQKEQFGITLAWPLDTAPPSDSSSPITLDTKG